MPKASRQNKAKGIITGLPVVNPGIKQKYFSVVVVVVMVDLTSCVSNSSFQGKVFIRAFQRKCQSYKLDFRVFASFSTFCQKSESHPRTNGVHPDHPGYESLLQYCLI